ncbi:hypothetical protein EGW08_021824 [Elysia chlorotica]|uniref:Hcy-binding domain-containing protein n=1 Tax=Elysia chlorotica TaxID=188477 RepID=A0A3S1ARZ5_ELYCH|nr:hypothetical protein EGW08_021824 [Elysia chlorotica]
MTSALIRSSKNVVVLDGGTGTSLANLGHSVEDLTWCSGLIETHPHHVKQVHKDFFIAGADVVCTSTYQAFVDGFVKQFGVSEQEALDLIKRGVKLAKEARDEAELETGRHGFVAASVGAYGATLCDKSEYSGVYVDKLSREELYEWHLPRMRVLCAAGPDILACETIPAVEEALALVRCLETLKTHAWITFSLRDAKSTCHGEDIRVALAAVVSSPYVVAVGANCFSLTLVDDFLRYVKDLPLFDKPLIIKPNAEKSEHDRSLSEQKLHERVLDWVDAGASWIGGCCKTDSTDIASVRDQLAKASHICFKKNGEALF